jgi:hypothetical protein
MDSLASLASLLPSAGSLTSWVYPIRGIYFLCTTPQLWHLVLRFLGEC